MSKINFSKAADVYEKTALVQKSASKVLLDLLSIKNGDDVLDLGCGPGNISMEIAKMTKGRVVGIDVAPGMIEKARQSGTASDNVTFAVRDAADFEFSSEFDVIFSNSAFQWFRDPDVVLKRCFNALKQAGRMGIQAPATRNFCTNFVAAEEKIRSNPVTSGVFSDYRSPWLFLEDAKDYARLFERNGFRVSHCQIVQEETLYSVNKAFKIYQSGAENGYLNQDYYQVSLSLDYVEKFRELFREALSEQAREDGMVPIVFNRIYLIAHK
ncbi:methyltransferase domain-containing protein [Desulfosporosinus sp. FKA]|uniref:class I SAM-dependent methyltransferase n=1 Tax=Desulfosporosinus sp. FKA TaxID=1969834 RepID=UPI000B498F44|nr:methyltransferase domain-containing protein [Desulfosporosinus sp. FKA]